MTKLISEVITKFLSLALFCPKLQFFAFFTNQSSNFFGDCSYNSCDFFIKKRQLLTISNKILFNSQSQNYNLESFCSMFPNDDICNIRAAKSAARRIFDKYKMTSSQQSECKGLGQQQVSGLIKNAYTAINMAYDPSLNDVSSFMSVFGVGQNGTIELNKLQELAVKYLCGEAALKFQTNNPQKKDIEVSIESKIVCKVEASTSQNLSIKPEFQQKVQYQNPLQFKNTGKRESSQISQSNNKNLGLKFLSPKAVQTNSHFSSKENTVIWQKNEMRGQVKRLSYSQILNNANQIFNKHKNTQKMGITIDKAPQVMVKTYQMMGKMKFTPSEQDVKIWMKLCDVRKNGVVEWASYQNFVKRMMQRQSILQENQK